MPIPFGTRYRSFICGLEKTARPRQVALHSGLHRRGARTRSCPYGRTPLVVGWGNPRTLEVRGRYGHRKRAH